MGKKYLLILLTLLLFCGCISYYRKKATECEKVENYTEAIKYLDKILAKNPSDYDVYMRRGACRFESGDTIGAVADFNAGININSDGEDGYLFRAETEMRMEDYAGALRDYNIVLGKRKVNIVGNLYMNRNPTNLPFTRPTESNGGYASDFDIYTQRGIAYFYLDSLKLAARDFNHCIANNKNLAECYYWRGHTYLAAWMDEQGCKDLSVSASMGYEFAIRDYQKYCNCK